MWRKGALGTNGLSNWFIERITIWSIVRDVVVVSYLDSEAYSDTCYTSKVERFEKIINAESR